MHSTKDHQPSADARSKTYKCSACPNTYSSISGLRGHLNKKNMPYNGVNIFSYIVLDARKLVFGTGDANSKGADPRRLVCVFVIHLLESIISELASSEILIFQLVSISEQAGLNLTVRNLEDRVCRIEAHIFSIIIYGYIRTLPSTLENNKAT